MINFQFLTATLSFGTDWNHREILIGLVCSIWIKDAGNVHRCAQVQETSPSKKDPITYPYRSLKVPESRQHTGKEGNQIPATPQAERIRYGSESQKEPWKVSCRRKGPCFVTGCCCLVSSQAAGPSHLHPWEERGDTVGLPVSHRH